MGHDPVAMPPRPANPYRTHASQTIRTSLSFSIARDVAVVLMILAAIASIAHWSDAIETFATSVLGFPKLP